MSGSSWDGFAVTPTWQEFMAIQEKQEWQILPEQHSALEKLFSDSHYPVSQVAQQIAAPWLAEAEKDSEYIPEEGTLWRTIGDAVKQLTEKNDRLFQLVIELQKLDGLDYSFKTLTGFHQHWTEFMFNCKQSQTLESHCSNIDEVLYRW